MSRSETECSPLVVHALEQRNEYVLLVWYFLCLEWQTFSAVFCALSFQTKEKSQNGELLLLLAGFEAEQEAMKEQSKFHNL